MEQTKTNKQMGVGMKTRKFKPGDKVEVNGNKECRVLGYPYHDSDLVDVRFWSGSRLVGESSIGESDIKLIEEN